MSMRCGHSRAHFVDALELFSIETKHGALWSRTSVLARLENCKTHESNDRLDKTGLPEETELRILDTEKAVCCNSPLDQLSCEVVQLIGL